MCSLRTELEWEKAVRGVDGRHARCASCGPRDARSVDDNWGFRVAVSLY